MSRNVRIVVLGGEGVGKSTLVTALKTHRSASKPQYRFRISVFEFETVSGFGGWRVLWRAARDVASRWKSRSFESDDT